MPRKVREHVTYHVAMRKLETDLLRWYFREAGGNLKAAAQALGVPHNFIYRRLAKLGLDPKHERRLAQGKIEVQS